MERDDNVSSTNKAIAGQFVCLCVCVSTADVNMLFLMNCKTEMPSVVDFKVLHWEPTLTNVHVEIHVHGNVFAELVI